MAGRAARREIDEQLDASLAAYFAFKEILKLRKQDKDERDEHETLLEAYLRAMDALSPKPMAQAA